MGGATGLIPSGQRGRGQEDLRTTLMSPPPPPPACPHWPGGTPDKGSASPLPRPLCRGAPSRRREGALSLGSHHLSPPVCPPPALGGRGRDASAASTEGNASPGRRCPSPAACPSSVSLSGHVGHHCATDPAFRAVESHADRKASEATLGSLPSPGPAARAHLVAQMIGMRWVA